MSLANVNQRRLREILKRAFPSDTPQQTLDAVADAFDKQRDASPQPLLHDLRVDERLRAIETKSLLRPMNHQEVIDDLVVLHDAGR